MRVCYVTSDMDAPGCYRCLFPGRQLGERGHTVLLPPRVETEEENGRLIVEFKVNVSPPDPMADIYVLQQRKERWWAEGGIQHLRHWGVVTVADCDDNYLELPTYNPAFVGTHPYRRPDGVILTREVRRSMARGKRKKLNNLGLGGSWANKSNRDWMHEGFTKVDAMTVSTPYLKDLYSRFNSNIRVIRNYLDWEMWDDVTPQYEVERERTRVGYMGLLSYRAGDLEVIRGVVKPFLLAHPEVDFVATNDDVHDFLDVPKGQRITTGDVAFRSMRLAEITAVMDIGLVPLARNGLNEAKSHLKGMEYNACGIPFIATPTESYASYWCDKRNGVLAASPHEWRDSLELLLADDAQRRTMGRYGRAKAEQHSIQNNVGEWEDFYLSLLGGEEEHLARRAVARGAIQKVSELAPLLGVLKNRPPRVVVEIGSARGGTFWAWCRVATDDALLVSIDLPGGDFGGSELSAFEKKGEDKYGPRNKSLWNTYGKRGQTVKLIEADSQKDTTRARLERILAGRQIDFLMIDGDHAYPGVKRDYDLYSPLVSDGGLIAFHDILPHPQELRSQVHKLWGELKGGKTTMEFLNPGEDWGWGTWGGIGVLVHERARVAA